MKHFLQYEKKYMEDYTEKTENVTHSSKSNPNYDSVKCALCDACTFTYMENFWWTPDFLQMMENLQFEFWQNAKLGIKMLLFDLRPAMYEQTLEHV